ncbi:MAG: acyltransferase [Mogibacterium sp.]|nr:acyltransferase [Mogibacterium sp.]
MKNQFNLNLISKYRDELFGIAIIAIVFFHFCANHVAYYGPRGANSILFNFTEHYLQYVGSIGVEIFVFLSGVGLYYSFSKNSDTKCFFKKRGKRILTPYLIIGISFWTIKDLIILKKGIAAFVKDLSFYSFFSDGVRTIWYIFLMIVLYLLFPSIYYIIHEKKIKGGFAVLLLITLIFPAVLMLINNVLYSNISIAITRIPIFIVGVYAGRLVKEEHTIDYNALVILVASLFIVGIKAKRVNLVSYISRYIDGCYSLAIIAFLICILELVNNTIIWKKYICGLFRFAGKYSLELYLTHVTLRNLMGTVGMPRYRTSVYCAMVVVAVVLSLLLNKLCKSINNLKLSKNKSG